MKPEFSSTFSRLLTTCFCVLLFLSCPFARAQQVIQQDTLNRLTIRIDPGSSNGGNASDFFDEVNYIPLETTKESVFGNINQLEVVDDYYIILDHSTNAIFIFDKKGKFHAKIKGKSTPIWRFTLNRWDNKIAYSIDNYATIIYCDYNGKVTNVEKNKDPKGNPKLFLYSFFISPDKTITYFQYNDIDSSSKYFQPYFKNLIQYQGKSGKVYAVGMPYTAADSKIDVVNSGNGRPLTNYQNDTTFFFSKPYANAIYAVSPNKIKLLYQFIFPLTSSIPMDFTFNPIYDTKRLAFLERHQDLIFSLNNFYKVDDNLFFKASMYRTSKEDNLIYNLTSKNLIAYRHISTDPISYYLPLFDALGSNFDNVGIAACDGTYFYNSISSFSMFKADQENKDRQVRYNQTLRTYFTKGSKKDNPVILQFKLKTRL